MTVSQFQIPHSVGLHTGQHHSASHDSTGDEDRDRLQQSAEAALQLWGELFRPSTGVLEDDLEGSTDAELLAFLDALAAHHRQLSSVLAVTANEIATRSRPSLDGERLTFRYGYRTPEHLVSERTHIDHREAKAMVKVGRAIIGDRGLSGDRVPAMTECVAEAVRDGELGLSHANEIVGLVRRLSRKSHVPREDLRDGERMLVRTAQEGMPLPDFRKVIARWEAHLDPDGVAPSIENQRAQRSLSFRVDADSGMTYLRGKFDAESAAYITHAIESYATGVIRNARGFNRAEERSADATSALASAPVPCDGSTSVDAEFVAERPAGVGVHFRPTSDREAYLRDQVHYEQRSIPQIQADALVDFAKHVLGCDQDRLPGVSTTVVVRIDSEDLVSRDAVEVTAEDGAFDSDAVSRTGYAATVDGGTVIDFTTARRLAAAAGLIPTVLGADGVTLDMGREARHFTRYQRLALVERDGGCAFCGLPPGMTEAHHLRWWTADHGTTDLDNGILLCTSCHHRVHAGWEIRIAHRPEQPPGANQRGGTVWFLPPASIDPEREPRLGGRKRFDLAYRAANPPTPIPEFRSQSWVSLDARLVE